MSAVSVAVIAVGNPFRGDDGVAFRVVKEASPRFPGGTLVIETDGESTRLLDAWRDAATVVVVDAARSGSPPGTVHRLEAVAADGTAVPDGRWPAGRPGTSTHGAGVRAAVELGRALHLLPGRLVVVGIEGHDFAAGEALSPAVTAALPEAVDALVAEVVALSSGPAGPSRCHPSPGRA